MDKKASEDEDVGEKIKEKDIAKKQRHIVFIGNLSFSSTKEDVKEQFEKLGGFIDFRLLTKSSGESKGCGFLEFDNVMSQQKALKYHHTNFQGRKINVEATCGGGGKSNKRKEKIIAKNKSKKKKNKDHSKKTRNDAKKLETDKNSIDTDGIEQSGGIPKKEGKKGKNNIEGNNNGENAVIDPISPKKGKKGKKKRDHEEKEAETKKERLDDKSQGRSEASKNDKQKKKSRKRKTEDDKSPKKHKYCKD